MPLSKGANERLWDAVIKEALIESMRLELDEAEQNAEPHSFSPQFEHNMKKLSRSIGIKEKSCAAVKVICKFAVTAAAVMGISFGGLLTQHEVYAAVSNVVRDIFSTHDKYTYQGSFDSDDMDFDDSIEPEYVPEGYELRSVLYAGGAKLMTYESKDEKTIDFEYCFADGTAISVDNERHRIKEINKNDQTYYYYEAMEEDDLNVLVWYSGEYFYDINAQLPEEEFVKIAESIKF